MNGTLLPLQLSRFAIEDNPANVPLFFTGIGIIILISLGINRFNKKITAKNNASAAEPRQLFKTPDLWSTAKSLGLNAPQTKMLDFVLRNAAVTDPKPDMADPELADTYFEQAYQTIKEGQDEEDVMQNRLTLLFSTRNSIEAARNTRSGERLQRRFKRKEAVIPCNLYTVRVKDTGRKKERKMIVAKRPVPGSIQDISVGGCAIKSNAAIPVETRLKITFEHSGVSLAVLGQVLRFNQSAGTGTVLHVTFIKAPRKAMNGINALVFGYNDN
jgi:hypothetical protein